MANFWAWLFIIVIVLGVIAYANPQLLEDVKVKISEKLGENVIVDSTPFIFNKLFTYNIRTYDNICESLREKYEPSIETKFNPDTEVYWASYTGTEAVKKVRMTVTKMTGTSSYEICEISSNKIKDNLTCETKGYDGTIKSQLYIEVDPPCKVIEITLKPKSKDKSTSFYVDKVILISDGTIYNNLDECSTIDKIEIFPELNGSIGSCFDISNISDDAVLYIDWRDEDWKTYQEKIKIK